MNLTDREILELNELCNAVVDGTLNDKQNSRLAHWLATSVEARQFYVRALGQSASLYSYASEMQTEAVEAVTSRPKIIPLTFQWWIGLLAAAAVVLVFWIMNWPKPEVTSAEAKADESVAQLTASKDCRWVNNTASVQPGDRVRKGQRIELASGFVEVTFDSGALVVLEGPASLEVNSSWDATLHSGILKASVPPEAIGFRVSASAVDVVDLGTEFTMIADASGATDVLVLKGAVEAAQQHALDRLTILLHEKESRHFAHSGMSAVDDSAEKFVRYTQTVPLDRFTPATGYVHWSFDEVDGRQVKADRAGLLLTKFDARLEGVPDNVLDPVRTDGRWQRALKFDGQLLAKAAFPGLSGNSPRTVAFWVKVPEDALLSDAYAMVAWRAESKKLGSRPVHICWNRNPAEGTVGVLRTDYGGGYALGATPLRDGRWHQITVVFVPGEATDTPVQVKQYVDGRLEGEGNPSPPGSRGGGTVPSAEEITSVNDTLWLGCRLGGKGPRKERFRGEMDELFIADRSLEPREIVQLMKDNLPPQSELAALKKTEWFQTPSGSEGTNVK
jgi:ferric-dicitrate binding protein FerR (iron transport regulator)